MLNFTKLSVSHYGLNNFMTDKRGNMYYLKWPERLCYKAGFYSISRYPSYFIEKEMILYLMKEEPQFYV